MTAAFTEPAPPTSETRAVLVNRLPTTALAQQFEHNLAIVVGINRYAYVRELKTARPDAKRLASLLRDEEGHRDSSDRYQVTDLYDEQANCEALSTLLFTTLPAQVAALGPNTRVLFYYAGHGDAEYADNVKNGFLFPQDAQPLADDESGRKLLSMAKVQEELAKLDCQHVFIILDCCSAGAMPQTQATRSAFRPPPLYWDYLQRYVIKPGLTGMWQINGRSDLSWEESVRLDLYYVENWSLTVDFVIMWRTVRVLFEHRGAY